MVCLSACLFTVSQRCSVEYVFLKISQNSQENTCVRVSFLIMAQAEGSNIVEKEAVAQLFSCEICDIFKSKFYIMKRLRWLQFSGCITKFLNIFFTLQNIFVRVSRIYLRKRLVYFWKKKIICFNGLLSP